MANVKLVPLALFLLATFLMFTMKKTEAVDCSGLCSPFESPPCGSSSCRCIPLGWYFGGICKHPSRSITKMAEEHPNLCQSHADCTAKGSGSFCARYPNPDIEYGWCFDSNSEAEAAFKIGFKIGSNYSKFAEGLLKMPGTY